jgi:hypothetical protein
MASRMSRTWLSARMGREVELAVASASVTTLMTMSPETI